MSNHLDANYPSGSRPTTTTDTDLDGYGTPAGASPFMPPAPLGGIPGPMPSAYSLTSSTPRDSGYNQYQQAYGDRDAIGTPNNNSAPLLPHSDGYSGENYNKESAAFLGADAARKRPLYKKPWFYFLLAAAVVVIALAVALPVVFVGRHKDNSSASASGASSSGGGDSGGGSNTTSGGGGKSTNLATSGGDGSTVTKADGTTFVYHNQFGGFWVSDPENPFNNSAMPNSWTPPLSEAWSWGVNRIYGVNLGGLFVLEPFISPAMFQPYPSVVDEWTLSQAIVAAGNNLTETMIEHYSTFIREEDIAQIAGAGLNWVRLPIPFWAIETWNDIGVDSGSTTPVAEPYLAKVCWQYILQVLSWCRKYGIRVNLDLHAVPGSQNGYNHSGKLGQVNFMNGIMGYANAQRTLDYIRTITEFVTQADYLDLIPMFSIVNEALVSTIGKDQMTSFYLQAHNMIRDITGLGEGHGPFIAIHDGFQGLGSWADFLQGSDRIAIDTHPYFAFDGAANSAPIDVQLQGSTDPTQFGGVWPMQACNAWGPTMNTSRVNFGITIAGEFSNGINDCGLYVRGIGNGPQFAGDCTPYDNAGNWTDQMKNGFLNFQLASMDALQDWFFWTWKIGNDSVTGTVQAPLWSYQLGLEGGWIPTDPRKALGTCEALGVDTPQFNGTYQPYMTGGAGAGTILPSSTSKFGIFPPTNLAGVPTGQVSLIPSYTATRGPLTLPPPSFTASVTVSTPNGWFDSQDTSSYVTAVSGCEYPDAYNQQGSPVPATACGATASLGGGAVASATPITSSAAVPLSTSVTSLTSTPSVPSTSSAVPATSTPLTAVPPARR